MAGIARDEIAGIIDDVARETGVNGDLYKKLIFHGENYGNKTITTATSSKGASGPAQVMPGNIPAGTDPSDIRANIRAGATVLRDAERLYPGNAAAQAAYYNGGHRQGNAVAAGKEPPAKETQDYLKRVNAMPTSTNESSGTRTSRSDFGGIDPAAIVSSYGTEASRNLQTFIAATQGAATARNSAAEETRKQAAAQAAAVVSKGAADADTNAFQVGIANTLGTTDQVIESTRLRQEAYNVMNQLKPRIDAEDQVSFVDDPLRAMVNMFTQPKLKEAYNAAAMQANTQTARIANTQAETQRQQQLTLEPLQQKIRDQAALVAQAQSSQLRAQADILESQTSTQLGQAAHTLISADANSAQMWLQVANMTKTQVSETDKMISAQNAKEAKGVAERASILEQINLKRTAVGLQKMTDGDFMQRSPQERSYLVNNAGYPALGSTLGAGYEYIVRNGADATLATSAPAINRFIGTALASPTAVGLETQLSQEAGGKSSAFYGKTRDERRVILLDMAQEKWQKEVKEDGTTKMNTNAVSPDNPARLNLMQAAVSPELQGNSFAKNIIAARSVNSGYAPKDEDLLTELIGRSRELRAAGKANAIPALAKELSDIYRQGALVQHRDSGAATLGLARPAGYALTVRGNYTDPTGHLRGLQMFNPADIEQFAIQNLRNSDYTPPNQRAKSAVDSPFLLN